MKRWWPVLLALLLLLILWLLGRGREWDVKFACLPGDVLQSDPPAPPQPTPLGPGSAATEPGKPPPKEEAPAKPPTPDGPPGVFGRVVRADRSPAADLSVTVSLDGKVLAEVRTGADGGYLFPPMEVPAGDRKHFVFTYAVKDEKGFGARDTLRMGVVFDPDEERTLTLGGCGMQTLVLRDAGIIVVSVSTGDAPVEGATVWAEEEVPTFPSTGPETTDPEGLALIRDVPHGVWTVFARSPGHGSGRSRGSVPSGGPVLVTLSPRVLEIEAVDASTGVPVEGVRFQISERREIRGVFTWEATFPPVEPPPTDSAGRTRLEEAGEVELSLRPIPRGREDPVEGTKPVEVEARATTVRVPVPSLRTVSWPVEAGERGVPQEGTVFALGEERHLVHPVWGARGDPRWEGTMRGGSLVVTGIDPGPFRALARAPDGSLARLEAAADSDRGSRIQFLAPRRLVVRVKDEDGRNVRDPVALLDPSGEAVAQPELPDEEGKTVFEAIYAGEVVVCALARIEWGGAEVARVDLAAGDRTVEAVVGRAFTIVASFRIGGKARLPEEYELRWLTPGPPVRGQPHEESVDDPVEDAAAGTLRLRVRPWAPGKAVTLQVTVPGRKPVVREILPPAAGGEVAVDIDLE